MRTFWSGLNRVYLMIILSLTIFALPLVTQAKESQFQLHTKATAKAHAPIRHPDIYDIYFGTAGEQLGRDFCLGTNQMSTAVMTGCLKLESELKLKLRPTSLQFEMTF